MRALGRPAWSASARAMRRLCAQPRRAPGGGRPASDTTSARARGRSGLPPPQPQPPPAALASEYEWREDDGADGSEGVSLGGAVWAGDGASDVYDADGADGSVADATDARDALELAIDAMLARKSTAKRLAAELGSWPCARMSIVDAESGFVPWLRDRAPDTAAAAAAAARAPGGLDQRTTADLLRQLGAFALEQSGEREETMGRSTDMTEPHEWYPAARSMARAIVMHVGPTNSGKTHAAMGALKSARSGIYCGPLRLLAWEVHDRLNGEGVACNLLTGQERVEHDGARHAACTIEMAPLNAHVACAVLDEIQMLGSEQRGWAWTRALLGLQADELHVCGDDTAVDLVRRLCALTGDSLRVLRYERLSPLAVGRPLGGVRAVEAGDALIAVSYTHLMLPTTPYV